MHLLGRLVIAMSLVQLMAIIIPILILGGERSAGLGNTVREKRRLKSNVLVTVVLSGNRVNAKIRRTLNSLCALPYLRVIYFQDIGSPLVDFSEWPCLTQSWAQVPELHAMFSEAKRLSVTPYYMYANSDLLFSISLVDNLFALKSATIRYGWEDTQYIALGTRYNIATEYLPQERIAEHEWKGLLGKAAPFVPCAQDYFIVGAQFNWGLVPDMLIGGPCWDAYMVNHAIKHNFPMIDLSSTLKPLHQSTFGVFNSQDRSMSNCVHLNKSLSANHACTHWRSHFDGSGVVDIYYHDQVSVWDCSCKLPQSGVGRDFLARKVYVSAFPNRPVAIAFVNSGFVIMTKNFLCNYAMVRGSTRGQVVIVATDEPSYLTLKDNQQGVSVVFVAIGNEHTGKLEYMTYAYWWWLVRRVELFQFVLNLQISVLHFEADATWFRDPLKDTEMLEMDPYEAHIIALRGSVDRTVGRTLRVGYGLAMFHPTNCTLLLHQAMLDDLRNSVDVENAGTPWGNKVWIPGEQNVLQDLLEDHREWCPFTFLNSTKYPAGQWYDDGVCGDGAVHRYNSGKDVWVISNNWIVGNEAKIRRARRWMHWFLDEKNESCANSNPMELIHSLALTPRYPLLKLQQAVINPNSCEASVFRSVFIYLQQNVSLPHYDKLNLHDSFHGCLRLNSSHGCYNIQHEEGCLIGCSEKKHVAALNEACAWGNSKCSEQLLLIDMQRANPRAKFYSGCCTENHRMGCRSDFDCSGMCVLTSECGINKQGTLHANLLKDWKN